MVTVFLPTLRIPADKCCSNLDICMVTVSVSKRPKSEVVLCICIITSNDTLYFYMNNISRMGALKPLGHL